MGTPTGMGLAYGDDTMLIAGVMGRRLVAWCIDVLVIGVIWSIAAVILFAFGLLTFGLGMGLLVVLPAVPALYHVFFLAGSGAATPGQRLMGLVVVRESDFGPPTLLQAILSTAGLYLTLATGVIWLGVALITVRHRTLHDMVAGLVVVNSGALGAARFFPA